MHSSFNLAYQIRSGLTPFSLLPTSLIAYHLRQSTTSPYFKNYISNHPNTTYCTPLGVFLFLTPSTMHHTGLLQDQFPMYSWAILATLRDLNAMIPNQPISSSRAMFPFMNSPCQYKDTTNPSISNNPNPSKNENSPPLLLVPSTTTEPTKPIPSAKPPK